MEELYRALVGRAADGIGRVVDYPEFAAWYAGAFRRADAALAWEEIRSIVKGACLGPDRALLRRDEYEALGRKRAPSSWPSARACTRSRAAGRSDSRRAVSSTRSISAAWPWAARAGPHGIT